MAQPDVPVLEAARLRGPPIVFLGLHETDADSSNALPSSEFSAKTSAETVIANIKGTPYFSLDVSDVTSADVDKMLQAAATRAGGGFEFSEPRAALALFDAFDAALSAEARSMVDWNARNKVRSTSRALIYRRSRRDPASIVLHVVLQCTRYGRAGSSRAPRSSRGRTTRGGNRVPRRVACTISRTRARTR